MTPVELLKDLSAQGAMVSLEGSDLRVRAPKGVLTEERREMLRSRKAELVKLLTTYACTKCWRFAFPNPNTVCYWCRK